MWLNLLNTNSKKHFETSIKTVCNKNWQLQLFHNIKHMDNFSNEEAEGLVTDGVNIRGSGTRQLNTIVGILYNRYEAPVSSSMDRIMIFSKYRIYSFE